MARLPGSVHGVVVQITTQAPCRRWMRSLALATLASKTRSPQPEPTTGNFTHTVSLVKSSYSTSASASAVFSTTDHTTGLQPR
jgi:hypothetical protein